MNNYANIYCQVEGDQQRETKNREIQIETGDKEREDYRGKDTDRGRGKVADTLDDMDYSLAMLCIVLISFKQY